MINERIFEERCPQETATDMEKGNLLVESEFDKEQVLEKGFIMWRLLVSNIEMTRCLTTPMTLEAIGMAILGPFMT
jgi:hypothetical protein